MKEFFSQLKWQFILLQKNKIISISLGVTFFYGLILWSLKDIGHMDKVLTSLVLNDPAVIGFFFIGLAISSEKKNEILPALFVSPASHHIYLISRILSLSIVGCICALALVVFVLGFSFDLLSFSVGAFGISLITALLGVIMITYTVEFLKFTMYSIPIFLTFVNLPLLHYLDVLNLGAFKHIFPLQGGLNLIINAYSESSTISEIILSYASIVFWVVALYAGGYRLFQSKIINS